MTWVDGLELLMLGWLMLRQFEIYDLLKQREQADDELADDLSA